MAYLDLSYGVRGSELRELFSSNRNQGYNKHNQDKNPQF